MKSMLPTPASSKSASFPCREAGCAGTITTDPQFRVMVQTSCAGTSPAARCPVCGRLHWPITGEPVRNRRYEKVFLVAEALENRPLESAGKLQAVQELVESSERAELIPEYYHDQFHFLLGLGHAADCPAATSIGECLCGHAEADQWLREHKLEEQTA